MHREDSTSNFAGGCACGWYGHYLM
jgi:hypothetical protein